MHRSSVAHASVWQVVASSPGAWLSLGEAGLGRVLVGVVLALVWAGCDGEGGAGDAGPISPTEPAELAGTVAAHNQVRTQVGLPPLTWDPALAAVAKAWITKCIDTNSDGLVDHNEGRSAGGSYVGENVYGSTGASSGPSAVSSWASESANYNYASNTCSSVCGHYTQIVWRETARVGCAIHDCPGLRYRSTVLCNYAPGGNINNRRPY